MSTPDLADAFSDAVFGNDANQISSSKDAKTWRRVGDLQAAIAALAFGAQTAFTAAPANPA